VSTWVTAADQQVLTPGVVGGLMWLVPLLPFLAFGIILFFGKRLPGRGHTVGIAAVALGLILSLVGFIELAGGRADVERAWTWFRLGDALELELGMKFDFLTAVMFVVITAISLLVQIYSTGYMRGDVRYTWYYAALSLFTASMLLLVISNNLLQMFVGWEESVSARTS
jgi:NADH-quinone oxidoreductase subunit L